MKIQTKSILAVLASAILIANATTASGATVIYRETFGNSSGSDRQASAVGWNILLGADAEPQTGNLNSRLGGTPDNLADVNAGTNSDPSLSLGYLITPNTSTDIWAFYTTEYTVDRSVPDDVESISVYLGNANINRENRIIIQIGSDWYASSTVWNDSSNSATAMTKYSLPFTTAKEGWLNLTLTPETTNGLVLGAALTDDLPSGNITGFGLLAARSSGNSDRIRLDTYEITQIPEPGSVLLISLGGLGLLLRRRRRS